MINQTIVKNGNHNLPHRKHEEMCVDFENEIENGAEATFAEIRDREWILKKQ